MRHQDWLYERKKLAAMQASEILKFPDLVIWDSETIGLAYGSEIVHLAAIDRKGKVLFDQIIDPQIPIPEEASKIHGLQDTNVIGEPSFTEILFYLRKALHLKSWCVFNLQFDFYRILSPLQERFAAPYYIEPKVLPDKPNELQRAAFCLMELYATFYGSWSEQHQSFTWQSLQHACEQQNIKIGTPLPAHNALGDCQKSLALLKHLAQWYEEQQGVIKRGTKRGTKHDTTSDRQESRNQNRELSET
jgi:DNA polymerase III epsilon subunit-like protein